MTKKIIIKNPLQIQSIREAGKYLTELLHLLYQKANPDVSLMDLEKFAQSFINKNGLDGSFKGYHGFPANLCLSVGDCVVHGIPDAYVLREGDLLKVDCGITYKRCVADAAFSKVIGGSMHNQQGQALIDATKLSLDTGIKEIHIGQTLWSYGDVVKSVIHNAGFTVIGNLTGHGVGTSVHEYPHIYNIPHHTAKQNLRTENMVVALEPITAINSETYKEHKVGVSHNGRNLYTVNGDDGAQREYTVHVTQTGPEILAGIVAL